MDSSIIILSQEQRKELTTIPENISDYVMAKYYTLSEEDIYHIQTHRRDTNKLGFAIQLCCIKYPGWGFTSTKDIPEKVLNYVSKQLGISPINIHSYGERKNTRTKHIEEICTWYGYRPFTNTESQALEEYIEEKAIASDEPFSLVKSGIDFLRNKKIILPGITTIERIVRKVCINIESSLFSDIYSCLVPEQYRLLDKIIESQDEKVMTVLGMLRNVSGQCSPQAFNDVADKLKQVRELNLNVDLSFIHPNRIKQIYRAASRYEPHMFRRFPNQKKYALLVIYLQMLEQKLVDMAVEIHDKLINSYLSKGRKLQDKMQQENGKSINEKVHLFINIGAALIRSRKEGTDPFAAIENIMPWEKMVEYIEDAKILVRPQGYDYLDLIDKWYSQLRKYSPTLLDTLTFSSTNTSMSPLIHSLDVLRELNRSNRRNVPEDTSVEFLPERWRKHIYGNDNSIDRHYYEMAVLAELKNRIRSGDVAVEGSCNYRNFNDYMLPVSQWKKKTDISEKLAVSSNFNEYIKERYSSLDSMYKSLSENLTKLKDLEIDDGKIHIEKLEKEVPEEVKSLNDSLYGMLPNVKLAEILFEVSKWTGFDRYFTHASSGNTPKEDEIPSIMAALMAIGTNIGLSKMADCTKEFDYHKLANISQWRLHDDAMKKAQACLVNYQHRLSLPSYWGDGTTSSSDGMRVQVGVSSLVSEHNPYYGSGKGSTIYRFVSDQYSTFYTKVINTNAREAVHVIDGLLEHETDLCINEHYTDTAGYTDQVFGLSHLLGFVFAPRIRDISDSKLYQLPEMELKKNINNLASARINTNIIEQNYEDILRLAYSIKDGLVSSSLILSKLGSYSRQNSLAKALQEMGRIEKTIFILRYATDNVLRRRILVGLNKGEAMNGLARAVFFGKQGELRERDLQDQLQRASALNILINAISIWNTVYLEKAVEYQKKHKGIDENLLKHISPLNWSHINFLGEYSFQSNMALGLNEYRPLKV